MTSFDDRRNAFENKYKHDEEMKFKATNRRNKLFGLWAAEKLGKTGDEAEQYAKSVVAADFEKPGDDDVIAKVRADLNAAGHALSEGDVRFELNRFADKALEQLLQA